MNYLRCLLSYFALRLTLQFLHFLMCILADFTKSYINRKSRNQSELLPFISQYQAFCFCCLRKWFPWPFSAALASFSRAVRFSKHINQTALFCHMLLLNHVLSCRSTYLVMYFLHHNLIGNNILFPSFPRCYLKFIPGLLSKKLKLY